MSCRSGLGIVTGIEKKRNGTTTYPGFVLAQNGPLGVFGPR